MNHLTTSPYIYVESFQLREFHNGQMSNKPRSGAIRQLEISTISVKQTFNTPTLLTFQNKILQTLIPLCLTYGAMLVSRQILMR
jgi:phage replication-related protein YjqB (UPF0714/DUF867 family)